MSDFFELVRQWAFVLGDKYGVNPVIFGSIYIGAIPFFTLSVGWLVQNYRKQKPVILPAASAVFFFISAYLYLIIEGKNVPWWVYVIVVLMMGYGIYATVKNIRLKISSDKKK